jgi:signal transduction histidine kinase
LATKLRNFRTSMITKVIAFVLVVISITASVVQIHYLSFQDTKLESLFVKEYKDSDDFLQGYVYSAFSISIAILNGVESKENRDFYYFITDGKKISSNTQNTDKRFFEQYDKAFYAFEKGIRTAGKNSNPKVISQHYYNMSEEYTAYVAFTDDFLNEKQIQWQQSRDKLISVVINMGILIVLALILIIYLILVTGRKPEDKELHLCKLDSIYSDILIFSFFPIGMLWLNSVMDSPFYRPYTAGRLDTDQVFSMVWVGVITAAIAVVCGVLLLSIVRKIKASKLIKHSLIFIICYKVYDFFKSLFDGRMFEKYPLTKSLFYRQVMFISASAVLVFFTPFCYFAAPPLFFVPIILEIMMIYWYIKGNNKTFTDINKGFNESLEEQMKSERMKIALVTNVSHDLKTPLTSIISYVDLLAKEEDLSETASDYVKILAEKSNRLKNIVADLFDLAKSTSGDIALELETLDMKKLIEQTLGDMEDDIEKSGLQIKTKLTDNPVNIVADGKKLYRVFQNVICNALKYSLKDTRIFVDLEENNGKAVVTIKNIAGYEMDFTADEILQRFNRGDKSRTTEGSGLGLSIAESFTKVCGGEFQVEIDGDLFKVIISFNAAG